MVTAPTGETRWTAILSTDMVDFTQITQNIGNEKVYELLQHVLGIARDVVDTHGGHIIDTAGDGILAAFGAPKALENASVQGCAAAHAFRKRIKADGPDLKARFGIAPQFRTGLAGGNAMIAIQSDTSIKVVGDPVNQAARLQALAGPDEVLLSDSIRREAEGFVTTTDQGTQTIKGFKTPVHIHALAEMLEAVTRFEGTRRRGIVALVSREAELAQALDTLQSKPAKLLMVVGVPGVGKSRLTHEIMRRLPPGKPIYIGQCAPTGQTPFGPIYDILRQASGTHGTPEEVLQSLAHLCDTEALASVLAPIDDNTDTLQRAVQERTLLSELLRALHAQTRAVYVIEDVHWIDSGTNGLIEALAKAPLPVLITTRPTFQPKWQDNTAVSAINLAPLNETAIREIVQARFDKAAAPALANLIATKSEGIPLIAEEIIRALQHGDQLIDTDAGLNLAGDNAALVTGNLEHMVLARVDRLPKAQKTLLQVAAAIGRDFPGKVLQQASGNSEPLTDLEGLIAPLGGDKWQFSHALIRDAVYDSLLSGQREAVHGQIGQALENQQGSPNNAALADHFSKANNPSKAVRYILAAARDSLKSYALADVDKFMEQAMTYLEQDDSLIDAASFGELVLIWVRAIDQLGSFGKVLAIRDRTRPQLVRLGRTHETALLDAIGAIAMTHLPDYKASEALALATLEHTKAVGDDVAGAWAKVALMRVYEVCLSLFGRARKSARSCA